MFVCICVGVCVYVSSCVAAIHPDESHTHHVRTNPYFSNLSVSSAGDSYPPIPHILRYENPIATLGALH